MHRWFILIVLMVSRSTRLVAQEDSVVGIAASDSAGKARQIIRLEQQLADALPGDSATWNIYLAPNWYTTTEDGTGLFREAFLHSFAVFPKGFSGNIRVTKPILVFYNNIAVIHYVADEHEVVFGQQLHTTYGMVNTWYKKDSSWIMLSMLTFEIPQLPSAIHVKTAILQQYTGTYRLSAERLAVVTLHHDTLFIQKGNHPPEALFAETENVFFRKGDSRGRKIFIRDGSGKMIMLERRNGQDLVWK